MSPHVIIDKYNLTISLLITIAWQIAGFIIAWTFKVGRVHQLVCIWRRGCRGIQADMEQFDKVTE